MAGVYLRVAVACPLRRLFDYLPPAGLNTADCPPGSRLLVPFAGRHLVGVVMEHGKHTDTDAAKIKTASQRLDAAPLLDDELLSLCRWAASYYHHPVGEVVHTALPALLREAKPLPIPPQHYRLAAEPARALRGQPLALLNWLRDQGSVSRDQISSHGFPSSAFRRLQQLELLEPCSPVSSHVGGSQTAPLLAEPALSLNVEQQTALEAIALDHYQCYLLEGVTGSGKTEVYLQLLAKVLAAGKQALVLIPEIGLTPQTARRFTQRFNTPVALLHSGLSDRERLLNFERARCGEARIVIGTRSAIFTPLPELGLIVVDEEHDSSYKQQDHLRYSARDLAVYRSHLRKVPVVLGSATPALETLLNAKSGRYGHLRLSQRAGNAQPPVIEVVDLHQKALHEGLTEDMLCAMRAELAAGNQALVFLNRRGYAPALLCDDCCWQANCWACSARLTVHRHTRQLKCHHCDAQQPLPSHCPECQSTRLSYSGIGTQRSEVFLQQQFAEYSVLRIDRDSMSHKQAFNDTLALIQQGKPCVLVGTQMLAKGHHFPDVTLVCMLDIDAALFSADFRAAEKMAQLVEQVAGRAGRADKPGKVLIQTRFGNHPLLQTLLQQGYSALAEQLLVERASAQLPPYSFIATLRTEHADSYRAQQTLSDWVSQIRAQNDGLPVAMSGPWPALMERRKQFYRFDLEIKSHSRRALNLRLRHIVQLLEKTRLPTGLRWSLDVDPVSA